MTLDRRGLDALTRKRLSGAAAETGPLPPTSNLYTVGAVAAAGVVLGIFSGAYLSRHKLWTPAVSTLVLAGFGMGVTAASLPQDYDDARKLLGLTTLGLGGLGAGVVLSGVAK